MNQAKTVSQIKGKYSELIDCLAPDRSSYGFDVQKLRQDEKEELLARGAAIRLELIEINSYLATKRM